jgi:hypothetical protein
VCLVLNLAAFAQDKGTITGKVSDTFGYPVSGASIRAKNAATAAVYKATSKATGEAPLADCEAAHADTNMTDCCEEV